MNWYKKYAQLYEEINRNEFGPDKEEQERYQAEQYFSIGQNEETTDQSYCWMYVNGELLVEKGHGSSHQMLFGHLLPNREIDKFYRGWYDPVQKLLSVVIPRKFGGIVEYDQSDIPQVLDRELRRKFGNNFQYKIF